MIRKLIPVVLSRLETEARFCSEKYNNVCDGKWHSGYAIHYISVQVILVMLVSKTLLIHPLIDTIAHTKLTASLG